jgi:hypothetical protein
MPSKRKIIAPAVAPNSNVPAPKRPARALGVPPAVKPAPTGNAAPAPAKPLSAPPADKAATALANRETKNADYFATARYPAEKLSAADHPYLSKFAKAAKAAADGIVHIAPFDLADNAAGVLVNNRARAKRLVTLGYMLRTGNPEHARFTFTPPVTAADAPTGAPSNLLVARSLYAKA